MSGLGAPCRTASPTAERARSVCVPGAIAQLAASASSSGRGNSAISNAAPSPISFVNTDVNAKRSSAVMPCARSNTGTVSASSGRIAPPLRIVRFAAIASFSILVPGATKKKGPPKRAALCIAYQRLPLLRRGQRRRLLGGRFGLDGGLAFALGKDERVALDGDLADAVHLGAGAGRNEPADDDVLLET